MGMKLGLIGLVGILLLTGCGQRDEELELSCEKMSANMSAFESKIEEIDKIQNERMNRFESFGANWDSASRRDFIDHVSKQFPFLVANLNEEIYKNPETWQGLRPYSSETFLKYVSLMEVLRDTGLNLEISDSQADLFKGDQTREAVQLLNSELDRIYGVCGFKGRGKDSWFFIDSDFGDLQKEFRSLFFSLRDPINCEATGRTTEYMAVGDGTPGWWEVVKCRA